MGNGRNGGEDVSFGTRAGDEAGMRFLSVAPPGPTPPPRRVSPAVGRGRFGRAGGAGVVSVLAMAAAGSEGKDTIDRTVLTRV